MQYQFTERQEFIKTIEFANSNALLNIQRITYFKEEDITGSFTKKEFRYSFDNAVWTNWNTLTQGNLAGIQFRDNPNFWLQVKYSRNGIGSGNIQRWYLFYESNTPTPPVPPHTLIDADLFQGQPPAYYLNPENHLGPYTHIQIEDAVLDASAVSVYDGRSDTSLGTTFYLRPIKGSGATTVYENNSEIIIGIDASFSGEVNYGKNIGTGDVSIYAGKELDALLFKTIKAGSGISLSYPDASTIQIDVSGGSSPSGPGIDGGVWITNIVANGAGNVGDKVTSSGGVVLNSCLTDTSSLTVSVLALPGHTNYMPVVTINSSQVTLVASLDKPVFTGTKVLTYNFADASITVNHEDGAHWSTIVNADVPPVILSANFIGNYPGTQTELKAGDTMQINVVTDVPITQVIWDNTGAITAGTFAASGTNNTFTVTIADRGDTSQLLGFTLRVQKSTGSTSLNYVSTTHGNVERTDVVRCNDLYPTISFGSVTYPATQQAIKSSESATVNHTITNANTYSYTNPLGQLTISNTTSYEAAKTVTYLSGGYNISSNNFSVTATRTANNASSSGSTVVWIANTPATLSVSNPAARLRSGGNDGTAAQSHTITITASQRLLSAPTLAKDTGGTWLGTGFTWSAGATTFTRALQVHDNDIKGTYNWGSILGTNLAGIATSANNGSAQYILGGFVVRTITLAAFGWQSNINVAVSDYSKLSSSGSGQVLAWTVLQNTRASLGNITRPQASTWSASATFTNPTTINILDESATGSQSQATTFTIQEGI